MCKWTAYCGDGQPNGDEACDNGHIEDGLPTIVDNEGHPIGGDGAYGGCNADCSLAAYCGDGLLDESEWCDGNLISDNIAFEPCPPFYKQNFDALICTDACTLDSSKLCELDTDADYFVLLSEVVPFLEESGDHLVMTGLALEFTNMGTKTADLSECSLQIYKPNGIPVKSYDLAALGAGQLNSRETIVICSQESDHFEGVCDYTISNDLIQSNMSDKGYLTLLCDDNYIDILNLNSFVAAVNKSAVDFVRYCDQAPVTDPANALLGEGWSITALTTGAPKYGLGDHCLMEDAEIESCVYTVDRTTLTSRSESIQQTLEIKIPGITTVSDHTDETTLIAIRFITGRLSDDRVSKMNIHYLWPTADESWTNADGIDRYIGTLHNYHT